MKREYNTPVAEKIEFQYNRQVVASGGPAYNNCHDENIFRFSGSMCTSTFISTVNVPG